MQVDQGNTQKSSMKTTAKGMRPASSNKRKVIISDDPKRPKRANEGALVSPGQKEGAQNLGASVVSNKSMTANSKNLLTKKTEDKATFQGMPETGKSSSIVRLKAPRKQVLSQAENEANFKIIDGMNKKISYLKNPRHKVNKAPILMTAAFKTNNDAENFMKQTSFLIEPTVVNFVDYQVNGIYEITVKATNQAKVSQRIKFIPPESSMFSVRKVKFPSGETGDIAPGMSLTFCVAFQAPSFADFDDFITFITEDISFKLPLRAHRDAPSINLVNPMDCLNSWLGDRVDMAFRCVNSGGDGGFKFFCDKDEDDAKQTDADSIRIGSFTLNPAEFYLYSGSAIDIYVTFQPEREGYLEEKLILACDNQTSEYYKVTGSGAMLDLYIIAVDGRDIDFKANPFETMYFDNTNPTSETRRTLKIKNSSPLPVPFHWSTYTEKNSQKISLADEQTHFRIEPAQGTFKKDETLEFEVFFCPMHAEPYSEFADLIVEDIPISAVRSPPEGLKNFAEANQKQAKVPMPTYVGSNNQYLGIPIVHFNLRGQGNSSKVDVSPPVTFFQGDKFINTTYKETVQLRKLTAGVVKYKLKMESRNRDSFDCLVTVDGQHIRSEDQIIESLLKTDTVNIDISFKSNVCGKAIAYFYVEIEDGPPVSFSCQADFRGPIVALREPVIDVGLAKVNTIQNFTFTIENKSPVEAQYVLKNAINKKMTVMNFMTEAQLSNDPNSNSISKKLIVDREITTKSGNKVNFDKPCGILRPHQSVEVKMECRCISQESIEEYFEVMVKDSSSLFFQLIGEVQKPCAYLNRDSVSLGRIYAGVREIVDHDGGKFRTQAVELVNNGNLPVHFCWEEPNDPKNCVARFQPRKGTIPPKQKKKIAFEVTVYRGGAIDELFLCDIKDIELPLGFELKADAFGLNVAYLTSEEQKLATTQEIFTDEDKMLEEQYPDLYKNMSKLKMVSFLNCMMNKRMTSKFVLKNLSGIATNFNFSSLNFEPRSHIAPQQKSEIQIAMEQEQARLKAEKEAEELEENQGLRNRQNTNKQLRFAASVKTSSSNRIQEKRRTQAILSDEHEQTQKFQSVTGNTFTQTKALEKDQAFFLSNNKGIALVISPHMGELPPNSEVPITITIYNNVVGKFDDKIVANVEGLSPIEFPVRINITGSPVVIPANQVGLNYNTIPPSLSMPTIISNGNQISSTFKIRNTGIKSLSIDWQIFDSKDLDRANQDSFKISAIKNQSFDKKRVPFKFKFQAIEPPESQKSPYEISPKQAIIPSNSYYQFTVFFNPSEEVNTFKSILLASPMLSQEEVELLDDPAEVPKKGDLGNIALKLNCTTIKPMLTLDKGVRLDNTQMVKISKWSFNDEDAPNVIKKLIFSNNSKADMTFNFGISGPFEIVKSKSNTGAKHPLAGQGNNSKIVQKKIETMFCLQPLKLVELHVKFLAPKPIERDQWPMIIQDQREGKLEIAYTNGDTQVMGLKGMLLRPKIVLLTEKPSKNDKAQDELDFGICNVDKNRTIAIFLSNVTEVTANWTLNYVKLPKKQTLSKYTTTVWEEENQIKLDDPEVFEFSDAAGLLKGKSLPLRKVPEGLFVPPVPKDDSEKQYLPKKILINFKPKQNVLYKSKFRFTVDNGLSCDVILKGTGSYEENHD